MAQLRLGAVQTFTSSTASQASTKIGTETYKVRVSAGSTVANQNGAFILFGDSTGLTVSSTNGHLLPQPWVDYFDVTPGQTFYVTAASTIFGTVSLSELS